MNKSTHVQTVSRFRGICYMKVSLCWVAGLLLGAIFAVDMGSSISSLMRQVSVGRASIVGLFSSAILPFLLAVYAVYIDKRNLLFLICFFKAFLISFSGWIVRDLYGSAGWLLQPMIQFSDHCTAPVLCWFSLRYLTGSGRSLLKDSIICILSAFTAVSIDFCVISPFVANLIDI